MPRGDPGGGWCMSGCGALDHMIRMSKCPFCRLYIHKFHSTRDIRGHSFGNAPQLPCRHDRAPVMPPGRATFGRPPLLAAVAVALVGISLPGSAEAGTPSASVSADEREAQRSDLYREATKAASAGRWADAKERLRAALAI